MSTHRTVLVTGATGNVGGHVVTRLLELGADVRALVREPSTSRLPSGVAVAGGDLTRPDTLDAALAGVDSVFLVWPGLSTAAAPATVERLAEPARRVVYLSAMGGRDGERPVGFWGEMEDLIERTGLESTFLRASGFATNTLGWAEQIRTRGVVRWPYGHARRSLIHEKDLAAVAALALTEDRHVGAAYTLTGPEAVSQQEQVRLIGTAIDRDLRWEEQPRAKARESLLAAWGDPAFVDMALDGWAAMSDTPEPVTTTVEDVTGVPARTFRQWALDHAADFR
ncbi:NAD(P)H-binding protein [Micromonospora sp. AMSO1212t]|uniref:SDR family oxidoreductase n=1 Tax=Micromonospora sp. AMSO1212t TaxID=2650565 RepID=UPI00124B17A6|nr:NAD(P)H-binding protein [Micromonospora sp. AMSO1212t]KAB1908974.1 NAD(P)H-binding protein [Micromonospora sp. AMSO1212t]